MNNQEPKLISCCELLAAFQKYYQKKFGVDGMIFFSEEVNRENFLLPEITVSLFKYFEKKDKLCEKCQQNWRKLKGEEFSF